METKTEKNAEEQLTSKELDAKIRKVQDWMIDQGYLELDPKIHRRLALHLWRRRQNIDKGGLILAGRTGTGKTMWLKKFTFCPFYDADRLVENYTECHESLKDKMKVWGNPARYSSDVAIDDFGQELSINDFGTKTEVMASCITMRYHMFQTFNARTYLSTNLTMPQIQERYGERVTSRLNEMCTVIPFNIEDQRKK